MKKNTACVLVAVLAGLSCYLSGNVSAAGETSVSGGEPFRSVSGESIPPGDGLDIEQAETAGIGMETSSGELPEENTVSSGDSVSSGDTGICSLLMPQEMKIVIDPWELDEKGQVYSEQYTVRNTGDTEVLLDLWSLVCMPGDENGASVWMDPAGIHDSQEKAVYMEIVFDNGDRRVLSQEGARYEAELEPGEELVFWFSGAASEKAQQPWKDGDVTVTMAYSWDRKEKTLEKESDQEAGQYEAREDAEENRR